uniref:Ig-like domain-containing protein n=1 Tax=Hippocampus comes TaxID=109280 RepID=A0A3Q2XJI5_HIPCM
MNPPLPPTRKGSESGFIGRSLIHVLSRASPPKFLRTPNDQTGVQGGVASFICQATGDPRPKIVWNKKGKKVSNQRFEVIEFDDGSGSVLRIQPLRTPRDEAIYECVASNSVGETSATTRLTVLRGTSPLGQGNPSFVAAIFTVRARTLTVAV